MFYDQIRQRFRSEKKLSEVIQIMLKAKGSKISLTANVYEGQNHLTVLSELLQVSTTFSHV